MTLKILFWLLLILGSVSLNYSFIHKLPLLAMGSGFFFAAAIHWG